MYMPTIDGRSGKIIKYVYIFLLGYIVLLPFYYFAPLNVAGHNIQAIKYAPLCLIMFLGALSLFSGRINIKYMLQDKINIYILIYFFLTLTSGAGKAYYPVSLLKGLYYGATGVLLYFIIYSWQLNQIERIFVLRAIVAFASVAGLYGILTLIFRQDLLFGALQYSRSYITDPKFFLAMGRISSTMGNPHFLGSFLAAAFPLSLYLHLIKLEQRNITAYLTGIASLLIFVALALTFSVGAYISVIFLYIMYRTKIRALYQEAFPDKAMRRLLFAGVLLLCIILLMMAANILSGLYSRDYSFGKFLGRIDFYKLANIGAFTHRIEAIKNIPAMLYPNLIFGIGIGKLAVGGDGFSATAMDNFCCLSLLESGLIPFIFMLVIFYFIVRKGFEGLRVSAPQEKRKATAFLTLSIAAFFINMLFWDVFNHPAMRIIFWSFAALLTG